MHVFTKRQTMFGFDPSGHLNPDRDEFVVEYEGYFATGTDVAGFAKARYPGAIKIEVLTAESELERSQIELQLGLIRL